MRVKYAVTIRGVRPYLHHAVGAHTIPLEKQPKTKGVAGHNPDEWRDTVRVIKTTRQLYVTSKEIWASWRDGSKHTKKGRGSLKYDVIATLQIESPAKILVERWLPENWETEQLADDDEQEVYLDIQAVRNPNTRGINIRYRVGMKAGYEVSFVASFDNTILAPEQMHAALIDAGALCGIGDGRNIGCGRFEVVSFQEA